MLSKPLYKRILVIDFETRWDRKDYTLSKMTTEQYIRDERFKAFGVCMKFLNNEEPAEWVPHDRISEVLKTYNWNNTAVLAHNAQFDVAILSWVYGVFDSLSMARALRGIEVGNSLAKLAFAIECKAGNNTTTALQERELQKIRDAGGIALVVNEENIDAVKAAVQAHTGHRL
jgi:hypothetical protein